MKMLTVTSVCAIGVLLLASSCSNSSSPALSDVSDVPSLDAAAYDFSVNSAVEGLTKLSPFGLVSADQFSRAACEGYTLKKQLFQDSRQVEAFVCYIKKLEKSDLGVTLPGTCQRF